MFLERTTLGLGAVIGAAVTVPVVGFAVAPTFIGQGDKDIDLGPMSNFPEGEWRVAQFTSDPEQGQVSNRTAFVRNNGLTTDGQPSFTIVSNRCVHLGCPDAARRADRRGRHAGDPARGQAARPADPHEPVELLLPLPRRLLRSRGQSSRRARRCARSTATCTPSSTATSCSASASRVGKVDGTGAEARIESYTRFDPGEHVDGREAWLYPASPQGI